MKKGFTLIELLAVIAILAIIMLIATPRVLDAIEESRINAYQTDEKMMSKATDTYLSSNQDLIPENIGDSIEVSVADLKTASLLSEINGCTGYVTVTQTEDGLKKSSYLSCSDYKTSSPIEENLVAWYKLDNNALDYSINSNNGVITGAVATQNRFGENSSALSFDGYDDEIKIVPSVNPSNFTITAWIYMNDINSEQHIAEFTSTQFYVRDERLSTSVWGDVYGSQVIELNKWQHVVITRNNKKVNLYVDGVKTNSFLGTANNEPANSFTIGHFYGATSASVYYVDGKIDNVKIYDRALSEKEVKFNFDVEKNSDM